MLSPYPRWKKLQQEKDHLRQSTGHKLYVINLMQPNSCNVQTYYTPAPDDILHTYSDWSQSNGAVGGRLELHRLMEDGQYRKLHGGFFSARVSQWQSR